MPKGRCTNFGNCPKADSGEIQDVPAGADFECAEPECESELLAIDTGGGGVPVPLKISALVVLAGLMGIGGWLVWPDSNDRGSENVIKKDSTIAKYDIPIDSVKSHTLHVPGRSADEVYEIILALYTDSNVTQDSMELRLQQAELTFPDDYRFTLERARHIIWADNTAHPFEIFYDAARKAIKEGKANVMLTSLLNDQDITYVRISTEHSEWNVLIEALEENEAHELEEGPHGH